MYKYLFGPVPSRRLGMSLGVDLIPHKICTLNCVYCECGHTTELTDERKEYVPVNEVKKELEEFFKNNPDPEYITFSGAGEPTLNINFGEVLTFIKELRPGIPLAVLTNGTLLNDKTVRDEMLMADVVLPSLDAATEDAFHKIDRPSKKINLQDYIRGLRDFREEFKGKIWLEVFILEGFNDDAENLEALKIAFTEIKPDRIQLNTLDRPGTAKNLKPASRETLQKIAHFFENGLVEIIAAPPRRKSIKSYRSDVESAILETIKRRPCTLADLEKILGLHINEVNKYLGVLEGENKIEVEIQDDRIFYHNKLKN